MTTLLLKVLILLIGRKRLMQSYMSAIRKVDNRPVSPTVVGLQEVIVGIIVIAAAVATLAVR